VITRLIQSASQHAQPDWLRRCMASVESWASGEGWSYRCGGDELFDLVPEDIRTKFADQKPLLADIARLSWARQLFDDEEELERVIWLDADVIVFAPGKLVINPAWDFAVGRQIWIQPDDDGALKTYRQVHNAILVMQRDAPALDFLRQTTLKIAARHTGRAASQLLGPKLLTALHNIVGFDVVESVGMASPRVIRDIIAKETPSDPSALARLRQASESELGAVNLCASYRNREIDGVFLSDDDFTACVDALQARNAL